MIIIEACDYEGRLPGQWSASLRFREGSQWSVHGVTRRLGGRLLLTGSTSSFRLLSICAARDSRQFRMVINNYDNNIEAIEARSGQLHGSEHTRPQSRPPHYNESTTDSNVPPAKTSGETTNNLPFCRSRGTVRGRSGRTERRASDANARGARPVWFLRMSVKPACMGLYSILAPGRAMIELSARATFFPHSNALGDKVWLAGPAAVLDVEVGGRCPQMQPSWMSAKWPAGRRNTIRHDRKKLTQRGRSDRLMSLSTDSVGRPARIQIPPTGIGGQGFFVAARGVESRGVGLRQRGLGQLGIKLIAQLGNTIQLVTHIPPPSHGPPGRT